MILIRRKLPITPLIAGVNKPKTLKPQHHLDEAGVQHQDLDLLEAHSKAIKDYKLLILKVLISNYVL